METIHLKSIGAINAFCKALSEVKVWSFDVETTILEELRRHNPLHPDQFKFLSPYLFEIQKMRKYKKSSLWEQEEAAREERRKDLIKSDIRLHPQKVELFCISFYIPDKAYYLEVQDFSKNQEDLNKALNKIFSLSSIKLAHRAKFDVNVMERFGVQVKDPVWCTKTMACVHNENDVEIKMVKGKEVVTNRYGLKWLAKKYLGADEPDIDMKKVAISEVSLEDRLKYCGLDAKWCYQLAHGFYYHIKEEGLLPTLKIETNPTLLFAEIDRTGLRLDKQYLRDKLKKVQDLQTEQEKQIYELAGKEFNVGSSVQLADVLFNGLGLTPGKKTKTGYSTDKSVLEKIENDHPIVPLVLRVKSMEKIKNTYLEPFLAKEHNGRIFPQLNPWGTRTGRTSSAQPNFSQLPAAGEDWTQVPKRAILPDTDEDVFISADQSQVEYRVLAHYSKEPKLLRAYKENPNADFHWLVAKDLFDSTWDSLTDDQKKVLRKKKGKKVNFATVYGQGEEALAIELGFYLSDGKPDKKKAKAFQDKYFIKYPRIKILQEQTWRFLEDHGYVRDFFGRKRRLPGIDSKGWGKRDHAKRQAFNFIIQGTASADLLKVTMHNVDKHLKKNYPGKARIVMTVYDELLISCRKNIAEKVAEEIKYIMENSVKFDVPLMVDIKIKERWAE